MTQIVRHITAWEAVQQSTSSPWSRNLEVFRSVILVLNPYVPPEIWNHCPCNPFFQIMWFQFLIIDSSKKVFHCYILLSMCTVSSPFVSHHPVILMLLYNSLPIYIHFQVSIDKWTLWRSEVTDYLFLRQIQTHCAGSAFGAQSHVWYNSL